MKKNYMKMLVMVFVTGLFANNLLAQGAYVNFNVGYGLSMSSQNIHFVDFYNYTAAGNTSTYKQVNVSMGKGLNVGGAFGYMFNKNLGTELGISYLFGGKSKAKDSYSARTTEYTFSSRMLRINPSLVYALDFNKINPYAKFGLVIGTGSIKYEYNDNNDGDITVRTMKLNGGIAFGLSAGIGAMYILSDKMSLFGELNMINLSYAPSKGKLTEATYNGADRLPNMTTSEKEIEFVNSYTYDDNNPPPDSQPSKELKEKFPFGSFGINIGLRFKF